MQKLLACIFIVSVVFLAGYLLLECSASGFESEPYFYDRVGELMLVGKGKDIYVERLDTGVSRKVTNTPDIRELDAFFAQGGAIIVYKAQRKKSAFDRSSSYEYTLFMQPTDKNDLKKRAIDYFLYRDLKRERLRQKDHAQ
ncbi:MAG: hypothetical protein V3S04_05010 [Candidatus Omnitrophota bacterium]